MFGVYIKRVIRKTLFGGFIKIDKLSKKDVVVTMFELQLKFNS